MMMRSLAIAALGLSLLLAAACFTTGSGPRLPGSNARDTAGAAPLEAGAEGHPEADAAGRRGLPSPVLDPVGAPGADPATAAFDVERLLKEGRLRLPHPAGGTLDVVVDGVPRPLPGGRQITVRSDGLPGLVSQRGPRLLITLATARGSYRLESHGGEIALLDQQVLDWRTWQRSEDYRVAPR